METQAWSSQPVQASAPGVPSQPLVPGQSTVSGPPNSWVPPNTPPSQSQGQQQTTFSSSQAQGYPPSPMPTFSYNGTSASGCSTESPKQSVPSTANSPKIGQGGAFASPASAPSSQPPIPGQSPVLGPPSSWGPPGAPVNSSHIPPRSTFTVPAAYPSSSTIQFSYTGSSQPSASTESPQQCQSSSMTTSTGMVKVGPHLPHASSSAQSTSIPIYATSQVLPPPLLLPFLSPNNYSTIRWQPPQPSPTSPPTPSGPPGMAAPTTSTLSQTQSAPPPQQSGPLPPPGPPGMPVSTMSTLTQTLTAPSPQPSGPPAPPGPPGIPISTTSILTQTQSASAPQPSQPGPSAPPGALEISVSTTSTAHVLQPTPPGPSAAPGPPGISVSTTSTSTQAPNSNGESALISQTALATPSSSIPNPTMTNPSQHIQPVAYQTYPPGPPLGPPPQAPWLHPPQFGGPPRPPFVPYPGGFPGSYSVPPRPVGLPQGAIPPLSQPSGTSPLGPPGASTAKVASGQTLSNFGTQLPPGVNMPMSFSSQRVEALSHINTNNQHAAPMASLKAGVHDKEKQGNEQTNKEEQILKNVEADAWTAHKTESGEIYYYNALTGESTYGKPPGFKGEPERVTLQPTPVSCEKLAGTEWALVTTNDGKKYYYNTNNQATSWQVPPEVADIRKKQLQETSVKLTANSGQIANIAEKGPISFSLNVPAASTGGRESMGHKVSSTAALDLIKKKLQDSGAPVTTISNTGPASGTSNANGTSMVETGGKTQQSESTKEKLKGTVTEGTLSDSTSDSDDEDCGPTKEERILQFKEMLKEKGVAPFSKWEKELPKIIFDPRFKAIPSYTERRSIFEHYVRTRADEERKEKRAAQKAAVEGFKHLLEEASEDITHKTDYDSFAKKWGCDLRFEALDRKERESLLNERVLPLRKAVEEKVRAIQAASVASFKAMLRENGDLNSNSRWSRVKDRLRSDSRYKAVKREDRESLFNEYVAELRAAEEEAERAAKAKREEEDKLKERKREMLKRKEREEQEMERVRTKARRKDAVTSYQSLLTEKIKDPEASWTESRPKLEKDPLGRATNAELDLAERERLFREHLNGLFERCVRDYRSLLADVIVIDATTKHLEEGKNILTSWSEAKRLLKPDPRYAKMPRRERESRWRRYAEDVQRRLKLTASDKNENKPNSDDGLKLSSADAGKRSPASRRNTSRR